MEVPRLKKKELRFFPSLLPGGRGSLQSVGLGTGGLVSSLTQRDSSGQEKGENRVLKGGILRGEGKKSE